jgi:hypothetical protein
MRFWLRELAGWLLVGLGLFMFYVCFSVLLTDRPYLLEAGPLTLIGIIVFRGGIHLLKVAVAARVCLHAQKQAEVKSQPPGLRGQDAVLSARLVMARQRK